MFLPQEKRRAEREFLDIISVRYVRHYVSGNMTIKEKYVYEISV